MEMKELLTEWRKLLKEEEEEREVFNTSKVDLPIPEKLKKLLNPDNSPQKFAALDAELDASDNKKHQAFALVAFAMTYANNKPEEAKELLKLSFPILKKIESAMMSETEEKQE